MDKNNNNFLLSHFISEENFEKHIQKTINEYQESLKIIDLKKFNKNKIDPIKLVFDKVLYKKEFTEIINNEIARQRDKTNNNSIGYFHQNIFNFISNCEVPKEIWDVIFYDEDKIYYIEMKNKHNTMNSSSQSKTYMRMDSKISEENKNSKIICALVEVISTKSQNVPWIVTIDKEKKLSSDQIRKISIDKFYEIVTKDKDAFYKICKQIPITLNKLINKNNASLKKNTVIEELYKIDEDLYESLLKLAFSKYEDFNN
ncbi:MAG: Eco47II family restriction endonuclease [Metamycoplasmataceae bacterium]